MPKYYDIDINKKIKQFTTAVQMGKFTGLISGGFLYEYTGFITPFCLAMILGIILLIISEKLL